MPQIPIGYKFPPLSLGTIATWENTKILTCIAEVDLSPGFGVKLGTQVTTGDGLRYPNVTLPNAGTDKLFGVVCLDSQRESDGTNLVNAGELIKVMVEGVIQTLTYTTVTPMSKANLIHTVDTNQLVGFFGGTNTFECSNAFWREGGAGLLPLQLTSIGN